MKNSNILDEKKIGLFGLFSRVLTKFILYDSFFFQKKLLQCPRVCGPSGRIVIGKDVNLMNTLLNTNSGNIYIGDYAFFGSDCMVLTGRHDVAKIDKARINEHPKEGFDIKIGKGVWISGGAIILGGVTIADYAVIAAGSIVTSDCNESAVYAGIPAKKIKEINFNKIP